MTALELIEKGFTPVAWIPPEENMEFEQWESLGATLQQINKALPWWIGDWLEYGEWAWGEGYAQAVDITGIDVNVLNNYKWVAHKVDRHIRCTDLSWSHHRAVASFAPELQAEWLEKAVEGGWTVNELRREINQVNTSQLEPPDITQNGHEDVDIEPEQHLIASPVRRLRYAAKMLLERHLHVAPYDIDHTIVIQAQNTIQETEHAENEDLDDE